MRPTESHTFKDRAPLLAPWGKPQVTDIKLTPDQVHAIVSASDPQAELSKVYRTIVSPPESD
jgi:hypothetical protein